eukprot:Amastigsp_a342197_108.p4 type:complete len:199 gc:universal Amastigsp_a342197_108:599-1195(+)
MTSDLRSSTFWPGWTTTTLVPATTFSRSCAQILRPCAANTVLWCWYGVFTRSSFIGCGVSSARTRVWIGPSRPQSRSSSPSWRAPLTSTTSIVVPRPSIALTSRTVASTRSWTVSRFSMSRWVSCVMSRSRSGSPSPVCADVGTSEMFVRKSLRSLFSQYGTALKPCSANASMASRMRVSNSLTVLSCWFLSEMRIGW